MKVEQLSIFIENKSGRLAEVTDILARNGTNIRALTMADMADFGILRLIVSDVEGTTRLLKDAGFTVNKTEVVAVELPGRPGGIAEVLKVLEGRGINVEYLYASSWRSRENAFAVFRFDEIAKAVETLRLAGVRILDGEEVERL